MQSFFRGLHSPHILFNNAVLIPFILTLPFLYSFYYLSISGDTLTMGWLPNKGCPLEEQLAIGSTTRICHGWYLRSLSSMKLFVTYYRG